MTQSVSSWFTTAEALDHLQGSLCGMCNGHNSNGEGFPPSTSVFPCQYHSSSAPYPFNFQPMDGHWAHLRHQYFRNKKFLHYIIKKRTPHPTAASSQRQLYNSESSYTLSSILNSTSAFLQFPSARPV